jgi:purine-binding chemotaxis protein CheW
MAAAAQYVTLGIDREVFAVPVERVREILDMREISHLPHAPAFMLGIIDVRGRSVPVIDLRVKLGLVAVPATSSTRILVLDISEKVGAGSSGLKIGLLAERVFEVTSLDGDRLEPPPEIGVRWRTDYIAGVGRRQDEFVVAFDVPRLFASEDLALLRDLPVEQAA